MTSESLTGTLAQTLGYAYDNDFKIRRFTYAGGPVDYAYDNDGLVARSGAFSIARNAQNGLPERVSGGALNLSRTFNGYGELDGEAFKVNGADAFSWTVSRSNSGRILSRVETVNGAPTETVYTYDPLGRLLTVTQDSTLVEEYQYGPNGTRTYERSSLRGITGRNATFSDEDHLLTVGDTTYQYDPDGFLTTRTQGGQVTEYHYSSRGELLGVTLPSGTAIEYVHDPLGRRIAKKVNGTITEKYLWQGRTGLLAVYDGNDELLMRFQYADGRMPVAMERAGVTHTLAYDQVGSLRLVADATGNIVKRMDYDSFGNILYEFNPSFSVSVRGRPSSSRGYMM